jgi:hypothetical protein
VAARVLGAPLGGTTVEATAFFGGGTFGPAAAEPSGPSQIVAMMQSAELTYATRT